MSRYDPLNCIASNLPRYSFSIGISLFPQDGDSFDALLSHADQAMYEAKQGGKNRYVFYNGKI